MKWICGLLVIANVALYLWVTGHPSQIGTRPVPSLEPVNLITMQLMGEDDLSRSSTAALHCARLGPFATEDTYLRAQQLLNNAGFGYTREVVNARELRVFRVFMGPFNSDRELESASVDLRQLHYNPYVYEDSQGQLLTVQMFSQPEAAGRFVSDLAAGGIQAEARLETRTLGPLRWLELADVITEAQREKLHQMPWRDAMTKVSIMPCG